MRSLHTESSVCMTSSCQAQLSFPVELRKVCLGLPHMNWGIWAPKTKAKFTTYLSFCYYHPTQINGYKILLAVKQEAEVSLQLTVIRLFCKMKILKKVSIMTLFPSPKMVSSTIVKIFYSKFLNKEQKEERRERESWDTTKRLGYLKSLTPRSPELTDFVCMKDARRDKQKNYHTEYGPNPNWWQTKLWANKM